MNRRLQIWLLPLLVLTGPMAWADDAKDYVPLFDGKTLNGWEGSDKIFQVKDGAIVGGSLQAPVERNEFLCTSESFGDFELKLSFKLLGDGANGGVQIRTKRIPGHHEVSGYQADMGDGWWGSLYDESRRNKILAKADDAVIKKALKPGEWNEYVIRCQGPRIQLWINGQQTVDYTEKEEGIDRSGVIGLQIHGGGPAEAWYKDLRIKKL